MRPVVTVLLLFSFLLAAIALFLNLAVPRYSATVTVGQLVLLPQMENVSYVTVMDALIAQLIDCRVYVQTHVPNTTANGVVPFNGTSLIAGATAALNTLAASLQYTGVVTTVAAGNVTMSINATVPFEKRVLGLGNGTLYYVRIPASPIFYDVRQNGTNMLSFDGWNPLVYPSGGAYNATEPIFDAQQGTRLETAPNQTMYRSKTYSYTAIRLVNPVSLLQAGSVVRFVRDVQI